MKLDLRAFELASGLKINFAKSSCGAFEVSEEWICEAANYLHCSLMVFPFTYLGIPIGANPRRCQTWDPIITKCERKLERWKQRHLSFGGRVTLINSVLTSLPIYFFSFFRVPKKVVNKLVRLQRNFLWDGASEQNKIAWIKWEAVCMPKEEGGLGVKDITSFNVALMGKWKWELFQSQGELWVRLLNSKYGGWRGLSEHPRPAKESIWWRDLKKLCQHTQQGQLLNNSIRWQVGCGNQAKFWEDSWTGGGNK